MTRRIVSVFSAMVLLIGLIACGDRGSTPGGTGGPPPPPPPPPGGVGPSLTITSISPSTVTAGGPSIDMILTGTGFREGPAYFTEVVWSGAQTQTLAITFGSPTQLIAAVPAQLIHTPASAKVFVQNRDQDGNRAAASNSVDFLVTSDGASISPSQVVLGAGATQQFLATVNAVPSAATWVIEEGSGGGAVTVDGLYTAPSQTGTFHLLATLVADPTANARATINVVNSGFTTTGNMHVPRTGHSATRLQDGKVLVLGGSDNTAELFDPSSGTFSVTGALTYTRSAASATLLDDGRVLVAGGVGTSTPAPGSPLSILNTAEIYDPATGIFSATGNLIKARFAHSATLLKDGTVLIAGGQVGLCETATAEIFDPSSGTFSSAGFMLSQRVGHTATLLQTGEVLIAGGANGCRPDAADDPPWDPLFLEIYDPIHGLFRAIGNMTTTRIGHAAVLLSDGDVLLVGGIPQIQNLHSQPPSPSYAEIFDPSAASIAGLPGISVSRTSYTATLLNNGRVLLGGGQASTGAANEVDLLDVPSATLSVTGSLSTARVGHSATLLLDGRVLVAGGADANGNPLSSAEIYH